MGAQRTLPFLLFLVFVAFPPGARAIDLRLSLDGAVQYDTNVFRTNDGQDPGGSVRLTPTVAVNDQEGGLSYRVSYAPTFQVFFTQDNVDQIAHFLAADLDYAITNKTAVGLANRFRVVDALNFFALDSVEDSPQDDVERARVWLNDIALNLRHVFNPRWIGDTVVSHNLFESERDTAVDSQSVNATQSFNYRFDGSNTFGGGIGATWQTFDEVQTQPQSDSVTARIFATYIREFGESTAVTIRGGPAYIKVFQVGEDDDRITFFVDTSISHRWNAQLNSSLAYVRSDGGANGLGSATITDRVSFVTNYRPAQRWDLNVRADWLQRESATDIVQILPPGVGGCGLATGCPFVTDRGVDTQRWSVGGRAAYRLTRRTTTTLNVRYSQQSTKNSTTGPSDFGNFVALIGIRYDFDPFRF